MTGENTPWRINPGHSWGPVELGMSRDEVKSAVQRGGGTLEEDDEDETYLGSETPWGEFEFDGLSDGLGGRLSRITVFDSSLYFGEEHLEEPTLDAAITAIGHRSFNDTRWTHGESKQPLPEDVDTQLLRCGVLWLISKGIGLEMYRGKVEAVFICRPENVPDSTLGQLTPQQLELATDPQLFRELPPAFKPPSVRQVWFSRLALILFVVFLVVQGYRAYEAETRWSKAEPIEGEIIETLPTGSDFPDAYVVKYEPPGIAPQKVTIRSVFIGGLLPVGKKVEIRYLPEQPQMATTMWEAREHGFVNFIPSFLCGAAIYFAAYALISGLIE
jgi:hypothetical protein